MAEKRSVLRLLRAHDRRVAAAPMPVGAKNRIAARLAREAETRSVDAARRPWLPMLTFAAGAALVMLVIGYNMTRRGVEPTAAPASSSGPAVASLGGYALHGDDCDGRQEQDAAVLSGECRMVGPHVTVQTWDTVRLELQPRTVAVRHGQAMFDVTKVDAGQESVKVSVSHGTIEVLGTRFTVDQNERGGTVDLFEGRIRFHHLPAEGRAPVDIHPGQRYAWGDRAAPEPEPEPEPDLVIVSDDEPDEPEQRSKHGRHVRKPKHPDADAIIAEVTALRGAGRYGAAARRLRQALQLRWDRRTGQVLSFELGQILERHLGDAGAACRHWAKHQRKYPEGRYAGAVATSLRSCESR